MEADGALQGPAGAGWLVLSGGNSAESRIRASVLTHANPGPIAYLALDGDLRVAQNTLDDLESLGAPSGYLVDCPREDESTAAELLGDASILILCQRLPAEEVVACLLGPWDELLHELYERGATLLAEGTGAAAFGQWIHSEGELLPALAWISATISTGEAELAPDGQPASEVHLHIRPESALALGPGGLIQLWGEQDVQITLGSEFLP